MKVLTILVILAVGATVSSGETIKNPIEVGDVQWGRDLDAALENSAKTGKPVLVLFQEIPGCSGVQKFGREVLTNPSLVEAIENELFPVLVYNNRKGGLDEKHLKRFQEPAWNYQVIRFLNADYGNQCGGAARRMEGFGSMHSRDGRSQHKIPGIVTEQGTQAVGQQRTDC
jgi:hypothetical protein